MNDVAVFVIAALTTGCGSLAAIELRESRRPGQHVRAELRFGRDTPTESVVTLLDRLAGLPRFTALRLEVAADHAGIRHFVAGEQTTLDHLAAMLRAQLPGSELVPVPATEPAQSKAGGVIRLRGRLHTIRADAPESVSAGLLSALQPLGKHERITLSWLLRAGRPMTVPGAQSGQLIEAEERKRLRQKNAGNVVLASGLLVVSAVNRQRAAHLLSRVVSVLRSRNTAYGRLQVEARPNAWLQCLHNRRSLMLGDRYAVGELAGLLAWPLEAPVLPGLRLGISPKRIAASEIPTRGRRLGTSTWPGDARGHRAAGCRGGCRTAWWSDRRASVNRPC